MLSRNGVFERLRDFFASRISRDGALKATKEFTWTTNSGFNSKTQAKARPNWSDEKGGADRWLENRPLLPGQEWRKKRVKKIEKKIKKP